MKYHRKHGTTRNRIRMKKHIKTRSNKKTIEKKNFASERREKELHYDESDELIGDFDVFDNDENDDNPTRTFGILQKRYTPEIDDLYRHINTKGSTVFKKILDRIEFIERSDLEKILNILLNLDEDHVSYDTDIYGKVRSVISHFGLLDIDFLRVYRQDNPYRNLTSDRKVLLLCSRNGASLEYLFGCCRTVDDVNIVIDMGADIFSSYEKVCFHHERIMKTSFRLFQVNYNNSDIYANHVKVY